MDSIFSFIFGALDLLRGSTSSPADMAHSLVLPLAAASYLAGAAAVYRRRATSPWLPMIVMVPAVSIFSGVIATLVALAAFLLTLGGLDLGRQLPVISAMCAICLSAGMGVVACLSGGKALRGMGWAALATCLLWAIAHQGR